jgi:hypothetical protein
VVFEDERVRRFRRGDVGGRARGLAELVEQTGLHRARIENRFEPARRELLDLLRRQVDAVALRDARFDVADDLIDVDLVRLCLVSALPTLTLRRLRRPAVSAPVGAAPAPMEVLAAPLMWMLICHRSVSIAENHPPRGV